MVKRIAVIGAGAAGLTAIKCSLDEGLQPVCYEITNDLGGVWNFKDEVQNGLAGSLRSTVSNQSKELFCYSDFPMPSDFPNFLTNRCMKKYLDMYAEEFNLRQYIQFNTEVKHIKKTDDFAETGNWEVKTLCNGKQMIDVFDGVMVCTGVFGTPHIPDFPGKDAFQGEILHTHDVRSTESFADKRVLVVGTGNSAIDTAVEISRVASQVYVSSRQTSWFLSRLSDGGIPFDLTLFTRFSGFKMSILPSSIASYIFERKCSQYFDHDLYGVSPQIRFLNTEPTLNEEFPFKIMCGDIIVHHDISTLKKHSVAFEDGGVVDNIDTILCGTGYKIQYPFIEEDILSFKENKGELYKHCFLPDLEHQTLALVGCFQVTGPYFSTLELQARWITRIFLGLIKLPPATIMQQEIVKEVEERQVMFRNTQRYGMRMNYFKYIEEITGFIGCNPNIGKLFFKDPVLAWHCFFGPLVPSQFRLTGPGQWSGARDAILTVWNRVLPINKNGIQVCRSYSFNNLAFYGILFLISLISVALFTF